jgi:hypothetical protein
MILVSIFSKCLNIFLSLPSTKLELLVLADSKFEEFLALCLIVLNQGCYKASFIVILEATSTIKNLLIKF